MAWEGSRIATSAIAGADLSAVQYRAVRLSGVSPMSVNVASLNTAKFFIGVLDNKPKSGEAAAVIQFGNSKGVAGATITAPSWLTHDSSGQFIAATSGTMVCGYALESAVVNDIFSMFVMPSFSGDLS